MATLRDIKRRIIGVKNIEQITKAMKMVAAAKLRRAQENIINARPYSRKISDLFKELVSIENNISNPLITDRPVKNIGVIVVTSDRGLCGGFNMNLIRDATRLIHGDYRDYYDSGNLYVIPIGKKGLEHFSRRNYKILGDFSGVFADLRFPKASGIMNDLKKRFLDGELDKVVVVFNQFKSVMQQVITVEQLLPVLRVTNNDVETKVNTNYIFEPDRNLILNNLLPKHLNSQMWRILLESNASELGARMTAMDMATENAKELISTLQLRYNRERQAAITTEILEIVSGANALKGE
jgi:F-type H+-transporting ATPase subunit gamma